MQLVVDTSILVGDLLREKGVDRLSDRRLELFLPERMWDETQVEIPRRVAAFCRTRKLDASDVDPLIAKCHAGVLSSVTILQDPVYAELEDEALARSHRDPDDWPVVACALALSAGIWTHDQDFFGTGVATWTTTTLQRWLDRNPEEAEVNDRGGDDPR